MKRQLLLFLIASHSVLIAQNNFQLELRQLESKYLSGEMPYTSYVDALNELATVYKNFSTDSVIAMQNKTIAFSRRVGYLRGEAEARRLLANSLENIRQYDAALQSYDEALELAEDGDFEDIVCRVLNNIGGLHTHIGNYPVAQEHFYKALTHAEAHRDKVMVGTILNNLANLFFFREQYDEAESFYKKTLELDTEINDTIGEGFANNNLGELYMIEREFAKALTHLKKAETIGRSSRNRDILLASTANIARVYAELNNQQEANLKFAEAIQLSKDFGDTYHEANAKLGLANLKYKMGLYDEATILAEESNSVATQIGQNQLTRDGHALLADIYEAQGNGMQALYHSRLFKVFADSLNNLESERAAATLQAAYEFSKKEMQLQRKNLHLRWLIFSFFAGFVSLAVIAFVINRNRAKVKLANEQLNLKNEQIGKQKASLEQALNTLKLTQDQLIQSEKLASLGELTAGIAHEIQNPLNFVNNFSEVSHEMLEEIEHERAKNQETRDEKLVGEILTNIKQNLEKINHHGKRADAIVKSMLHHSRNSSGKKEPTDLNALCDEYLRLAYHGLRAKDKSFNAKFETDFDAALPKIKVIPQDIGRVLLNLINNAFYAVSERGKLGENGYNPTVIVRNKALNGMIEIRVKDNGIGIPNAIKEKIFQPFFTTKPTGQGTGLGLSLSYDIVKAHGGVLKVETKEGEGSEFVIQLPVV